MTKILTADEAIVHASWTYTVRTFSAKPITDSAGDTIGWTFSTPQPGGLRYGWVLTDGQVSNVTERTRDVAENNARRTVRAV